MFDIGDKERLIGEICADIDCCYPYADCSVNTSLPLDQMIKQAVKEMAGQMAREISKQVVRRIITRLYTHSEFETDLGLRDGN